jgi:3-dehydroquinate synthase
VLLDKKLETHPSVLKLLNALPERPTLVKAVSVEESGKTWPECFEILSDLARRLPRPEGTMIVIGGGTMLNFGGFISATLHRGVPFVLVPTTVMAIADVAVGSKTSLNALLPDQQGNTQVALKHPIGVYANPAAVVLDGDFLATLSSQQLRIGLSESLKHGLLQDERLYDDTKVLIQSITPDVGRSFDIALRTLNLKSRVLSHDPWEYAYGRVLLHGHLHAHSLERVTQFRVQHGYAVYWGLLIDAKLADQKVIYHDLLGAVLQSKVFQDPLITSMLDMNDKAFLERIRWAYLADTKTQHVTAKGCFRYLKVERVAQFAEVDDSAVNSACREVSWDELCVAINAVIKDLNASLRC